jgi:hypothetical protein
MESRADQKTARVNALFVSSFVDLPIMLLINTELPVPRIPAEIVKTERIGPPAPTAAFSRLI